MNLKHIFALILTLMISSCSFSQKEGGSREYSVPDKFQNIESFIKTEKLNNKTILIRLGYDAVTAISTKKGIVVIDAGISTGLTEKYRKIIENKFKRNDFAYVINTHGHIDHSGGNSVFEGAVIAGHINCIDEISKQWKDPEKVKTALLKIVNDYDRELADLAPGTTEWNNVFCQKARNQYAYNDVLNDRIVTKPNLTFRDSLNIDMGDEIINLFYFGRAHSESDILVHIPSEKILMTGDLFSRYGRASIPSENSKYAMDWMHAVYWIENRWSDIEIIISGHGEILTKEDLLSFVNYVRKSQ